MDVDTRAQMTAQDINNLGDSDFAYIEPGGTKDAEGKTTPRTLRHFPIHDEAHVRNALARASQSPYGKQAMPKIKAAAKRMGIDTGGMNSADQHGMAERSVAFEVSRSASAGDGLTFEGYAAVFNSPTRISGWEGTFDEVILPGAFRNALARQTPVLMFEHGKHPLIGTMPLGVITRHSEDSTGLHIEARLSDNWLIQPVRDAVRDGGVTGMSFRFSAEGGDKWQKRSGDVDLRTIMDFAAVPELGPVVFPAYEPTTAAIRSLIGMLPARPRVAPLTDALRAMAAPLVMPQMATDTPSDEYADPIALAQAADAALDAAIEAMTPEMAAMCPQACALMTAADLALDALLAALGAPDPDDAADPTGMGRSKDLAGRPDTRRAGGSEAPTAKPAERGLTIRQSLDDGALRARGLIT